MKSVLAMARSQNSFPNSKISEMPETPDLDAFEERAAIAEFDGGLSRADAEKLAVQCQGYENVVAFRAAQASKQPKGGV